MANRRIRLLEKKRGERRTGSRRVGSYGEAIFFGFFLLVGGIGLYVVLAEFILPEWQANRHFVGHECVIVDKALGQSQGMEPELYRPEVRIEYVLDGETHNRWTYDINFDVYSRSRDEAQAILDKFEIGATYLCWYDPQNPDSAVLVRGYSWWMWLLVILPASFVVIGVVGLVSALLHSRTSTERRASMAQKAATLDLFEEGSQRKNGFPNVPRAATITDSPGTRLAYRLPVDAAPGWTLAGIFAVCLLWNGIVAGFIVVNVRSYLGGRPDWPMTALLVPLAGIGLGILYFAVRSLVSTTGSGATRIEIAEHPLHPGGTYEILLSQTGRMTINALEVALVCEEEATYLQGTDTRVETARVYEDRVYHRAGLEMNPGMPFEDSCEVRVPEEAMHSFASAHNEVKWKLVVTGDIPNWPDYQRQFPLVVHPPPPEPKS